uniref:Coiled-coil serine rich protein 2 n=1 Tax=Rousettus aegyptiacus TaxID=9407 RepID=A0A7J8G5N8_ROUAE|nr:coiled-coil serine rich protein 2 [Rousettus aegyptiacus]
MKHTSGNNLISLDTDYRAGSSFELSPSDSSDGTYMWDEEGLEPIGNVHPVGSYESSEMNSIRPFLTLCPSPCLSALQFPETTTRVLYNSAHSSPGQGKVLSLECM